MLGQLTMVGFVVAEIAMTAYTLKRLGVLDKVLDRIKKTPEAFKAGAKGFKEGYGNYTEAEIV